jgi:hypothetical protein
LKRIGDLYGSKDNIGETCNGYFLSFLILSSYTTEELDSLCAVGAFMMGSIMPDVPKFRMIFIEK